MKIYVAHATAFDYEKMLYQPLKLSVLWKNYKIILPHDTQIEPTYSKPIIESCDLLIAEVSHPSTGLGIELGWAHASSMPILCLHQQNANISSSLYIISRHFISYKNKDDMVNCLSIALQKI
jgi:nucleoside 2-deoxyribosyltransferase